MTTAANVRENVVARLKRLHRRDRIDGQSVGPLGHALTAQFVLRHMREVEEARALAHRRMLFENTGVLHGHFEAAERNHPAAQGDVFVVERGALQRRRLESTHKRGPFCCVWPGGVLRNDVVECAIKCASLYT